MSQFNPIKEAPPSVKYARRDWSQLTDGDWWKVRDEPGLPQPTDSKENARIRGAAHAFAVQRGMRVHSRAARGGREFYLQFEAATSRGRDWILGTIRARRGSGQ
jgi:hypothetical protein